MSHHPVFTPLGRTKDGTLLLYTAPAALTTGAPTEAQFADYTAQLRAIRTPWIWVVDCRGTNAAHFANISMAQRLTRILREEHGLLLKDTWVMYLNTFLRAALALFQMPVVALSADRLELLVHLQRAGVDRIGQDRVLLLSSH
jgi:hypothetical protein